MSWRSAAGRVASMDREELRFRATSEARKIAGRLRYSLNPPRWDRGRLTAILDARGAGPLVARAAAAARRHDYLSAHRALAEHFRARASSWPIQARRRGELAAEIRLRFPDAIAATRARADRIVDGRHDLLGYRDVLLGSPPDWHLDKVHQRRPPIAHWADVPYLDPASGDHKIIWETNRHQYFLVLGSAYWLTGDRRYRDTFVTHLEDWLANNPPLAGVNWSSMLELAFRAMSWTWAIEFFAADGEQDETPWLVDLLVALDRQLTHVAHNLSTYFSPNTHLSGEALALYAVSTAFPELRRSRARAAAGRTILLREAQTQVRADGGHAELSAHYHRYSTDFYLLALMVARASNDEACRSDSRRPRASRRAICAPSRTIADNFPSSEMTMAGSCSGSERSRPPTRRSRLGVAASLLDDQSLAVTPASDQTAWILGHPSTASPSRPSPWPSRLMRESGYFVSRMADGGHLVFDAGPHGFLNGGHAHADALAVVLTAGGEPVLVDPGTATYTMDAAARDRFRSSRMHNTLVLDDAEHARPDGPFHWQSRADARFLVARTGPDIDFAVGTHDGHGNRRHLRAVLALHGLGWLIVDQVVTSRPTRAQIFWHLHPAWRAVVRDATVELVHGSGRRLALATTAQDIGIAQDPDLSAYSPEYGRIEPSTTLVAHQEASAPFTVGTFIPAMGARGSRVAIAEVAASAANDRWKTVTFGIQTGREERAGVGRIPLVRVGSSTVERLASAVHYGAGSVEVELIMCGIAGFADSTFGGRNSQGSQRLDAEFNLVHRMCEVIRHRGPDDEGIHVEPGLGLGMRRLSIIDLAGGRQPIHNETSTIWVVFNGEIYNYRELRRELESLGHRFYTSQRHRVDRPRLRAVGRGRLPPAARHVRHRAVGRPASGRCCSRAIAPARSRVHYAERGGRLYFGSEIKSLLAAGAVDPQLNLAALDHYLAFLYTPRDASIFEGVRKLPPAHFLRWRDGRAEVKQYWQVAATETFRGSEAEAHRGAGRRPAGRGRLAHGQRRAARRVPLRRRRLLRRRRHDGARLVAPASRRSRSASTTRRSTSSSTRGPSPVISAPTTTSSSSAPTACRSCDGHDRPLRRAVRGLVGDPDVVRLGDRAAARHGRAVGRRRRRAVRRLRSLSPAPARRAVRPHAGSRAARQPPRWRGRCCRMEPRARIFCGTWPRIRPAATWIRSRCSRRTSGRRSTAAACGPRWRPTRRRRSRVTSIASPRCRTTAG